MTYPLRFTYLRYLFKVILFEIPPIHWLTAFELALLIIMALRRIRDRKQMSSGRCLSAGLLAGYMYIVLASLVLIRTSSPAIRFQPRFLWSYIEIIKGNRYLLWENALNILLFVPIGFLLKIIQPKWKIRHIVYIGLVYSIALELLQLALHRGLFEFDDMLHNTAGVFLGTVLFDTLGSLATRMIRGVSKGKGV